MKMKKLLYIFIALSFGLVSCSDIIETPDTLPADCIMLNVYNSPMTKAQDWAGLEYERQLLRLDCFFYPKEQTDQPCVYYQKVDVDNVGSAEIPFFVDESVINTIFPSSDECDVFIIANLTSGTFAKGQTGTDVPTLSKTVLALDGNRDAIDKPFIMQGLDIATKGDNNNASGTIPLHRAAAKVTVTVNIPEQITVEYENADPVTMKPVLSDDTGAVPFKTSFHNGVKKTYLRDDYSAQLIADDVLHVGKQDYVAAGEVPAVGDTPKKYTFTCEIPFYTYARAWEKGAEDAAYLTFEMPWTNVSDPENPVTQTYYYQILVNGGGRCFEPNNWYDLIVNVGVIGSTVESEPVTIQDLTYYILDWTTEPDPEHEAGGDRYEDVDITDYTYLIVHKKRIEMNNTTLGKMPFDASHNIAWELEYPSDPDIIAELDEQERIYNTNKYAAYYINCGVARNERPQATRLNVTNSAFKIAESGKQVEFRNNLPANVYSPIYVHLKVWLDINGNGEMDFDNNEDQFVEYVTFIQYPPIYITPHPTTEYSIYMNGYNYRNGGSALSYRASDSGVTYNLGYAKGTDDGVYMYTINVSSFTADDGFTYYGNDVKYIIGDPRVRVSDTNLNNDGSNMDLYWETDSQGVNTVYAMDLNADGEYILDANSKYQYSSGNRALTYYYPTDTEGEVYRVIAPKFRIVSFCSSGGSTITPEGAKMRCAAFQENGYPAGRWRLPTTAEISFIISLANMTPSAIQPLFYGTNYYYSSTDRVQNSGTVNMQAIPNNNTQTGSVRCVYDEWYWGSEQEAMRNPAANPANGEEFLFTWGDKKIW